jgi:hypothetical protein
LKPTHIEPLFLYEGENIVADTGIIELHHDHSTNEQFYNEIKI